MAMAILSPRSMSSALSNPSIIHNDIPKNILNLDALSELSNKVVELQSLGTDLCEINKEINENILSTTMDKTINVVKNFNKLAEYSNNSIQQSRSNINAIKLSRETRTFALYCADNTSIAPFFQKVSAEEQKQILTTQFRDSLHLSRSKLTNNYTKYHCCLELNHYLFQAMMYMMTDCIHLLEEKLGDEAESPTEFDIRNIKIPTRERLLSLANVQVMINEIDTSLRSVGNPSGDLSIHLSDIRYKASNSTPAREVLAAVSVNSAASILVTANLQIGEGTILGICSAPKWESNPTKFTKGENGWTGPVPRNQDWKFIILKGDKVISWEKGYNRRCNEQAEAFTIKAKEVRF